MSFILNGSYGSFFGMCALIFPRQTRRQRILQPSNFNDWQRVELAFLGKMDLAPHFWDSTKNFEVSLFLLHYSHMHTWWCRLIRMISKGKSSEEQEIWRDFTCLNLQFISQTMWQKTLSRLKIENDKGELFEILLDQILEKPDPMNHILQGTRTLSIHQLCGEHVLKKKISLYSC